MKKICKNCKHFELEKNDKIGVCLNPKCPNFSKYYALFTYCQDTCVAFEEKDIQSNPNDYIIL